MNLALNTSGDKSRIAAYSWFYFVFVFIALWIDSLWFSSHFFDGRWITNAMALSYFMLMYSSADSYLKKLMLVMVGLSFVGELIFCKLLGMYVYKGGQIPIYVPIGHSIVYASGYTISKTDFIQKNVAFFKKWFNVFYAFLFIAGAVFIDDYFSLISGVFFFLLLKRKRYQLIYTCIAFCVIYIEYVGIYLQCWVWAPKIFGVIPSANPPIGAVFYYAGGDVLLAKIVGRYWKAAS